MLKKRLCLGLALIALCGLLFGCTPPVDPTPTVEHSLGTDLSIYPVFDNLTEGEKKIYESICDAMAAHSSEPITIGLYPTEAELKQAEDRLLKLYQQVSYDHPDCFWVNAHQHNKITTQYPSGYLLELEISYIIDQTTAQQLQPKYDAKVQEIVASAQQIPDLFDRVLYVYDTIMGITEYDRVLEKSNDTAQLGRTAYGCLVEGKTVCSGYAMAFASIMEKLGIECGVEFDSYSYNPLATDGHVWNYCKLDGEYYYFDLTWDDTAFESESYQEYLPYSHLYFAITRDDLSKATYALDANAPTPDCTGKKYNYFIYQGLNFESYDFDSVKAVITEQEDDVIFLRFDSYYDLEQAKIDLIDNQKIFSILPDTEGVRYLMTDTDLHLMIIVE